MTVGEVSVHMNPDGLNFVTVRLGELKVANDTSSRLACFGLCYNGRRSVNGFMVSTIHGLDNQVFHKCLDVVKLSAAFYLGALQLACGLVNHSLVLYDAFVSFCVFLACLQNEFCIRQACEARQGRRCCGIVGWFLFGFSCNAGFAVLKVLRPFPIPMERFALLAVDILLNGI